MRGPVAVNSVSELAAALYAVANMLPIAGQPHEAGTRHVFEIWSGTRWTAEIAPPEHLKAPLVRAFRLAVHIALEHLVLGEDEVPSAEELLEDIRDAQGWEFLPVAEWPAAVEAGKSQLSALAVPDFDAGLQLHRLQRTNDEGYLAYLDPTAVNSFWSNLDLELRFFANADDERYSIQAHPTLLRNLLSQAKEYPVFVSDPITVTW